MILYVASSQADSRKYTQEILKLKVAQIKKTKLKCFQVRPAVTQLCQLSYPVTVKNFPTVLVLLQEITHSDTNTSKLLFAATVKYITTSWHAQCQPKAICPEFFWSWKRFITEAADTFRLGLADRKANGLFLPSLPAFAFKTAFLYIKYKKY